jgi:tight adherence protein B
MKRLLALAALAIALTLAAAASLAQADDPLALRLTPLGTLEFPARGYLVDLPVGAALQPSDVEVRENGRLVEDPSFVPAGASTSKLAAILAIDASNSMRGAPLRSAFRAGRTFAQRLGGTEPIGLIAFNSSAQLVTTPTRDTGLVARSLSRLPHTREGTHIFDALTQAIAALRAQKVAAGSIVLISDGADVGSRASMGQVLQQARLSHTRIFTVGLHSRAYDPRTLRRLAAATGGAYAEARSASQLNAIYGAIGARLASEYILRYTSKADAGEQVQVMVLVKGMAPDTVAYEVPQLVPQPPFHRSIPVRFWSWPGSFVVIGLFAAMLVFAGMLTVLRGGHSLLLRRMAHFVSLPQVEVAQAARAPALSRLFFGSTERSLSRTQWWGRLTEELEIAEIGIPRTQIVGGAIVGTLLVGFILGLISPIFAFFALGVPFLILGACHRQVRKVRERFSEQLPDNLQILASALRAGHSFVGSLAVVASSTDPPSRKEFQRVVADEQLGVPVEQSLREVARRMADSDLEQVALVAELQRHAGGNMAEVLDSVVENIRSRADVRRLVKTLTAQGRMARWIVTLLPVFLGAVISLINWNYINVLFTTSIGRIALSIAAAMVIAGSLIIKRIVDIKV